MRDYDHVRDADGMLKSMFHVKPDGDDACPGCTCDGRPVHGRPPSVWNWICAAFALPLLMLVAVWAVALVTDVVRLR